MVVTLIFMAFFVDTVGRRAALLVGAVGAAFAMFYIAIYAKLSNSIEHAPPRNAGANGAVAMIYIYAVFYAFSWNGIPWIFTSEVLPTRTRTMGMAVGTAIQWLSQFIIVYSLPHMIDGITYGTFFFFAACTVCAFFFAFFFIPETKGVPIEDMDLLFGKHVSIMAHKATKNYLDHREERGADLLELEKADGAQHLEQDVVNNNETTVEDV
jgi:MFS family permease